MKKIFALMILALATSCATTSPTTSADRAPSSDPAFDASKQKYIDDYYAGHPAPAGTSIQVLQDIYFPIGGETTSIGKADGNAGYAECWIMSTPTPGETTQRVIRAGKVLYVTSFDAAQAEYVLAVQGGSKISLRMACNQNATAKALLASSTNRYNVSPPLVRVYLTPPNVVFKLEEINYVPRDTRFKVNEI